MEFVFSPQINWTETTEPELHLGCEKHLYSSCYPLVFPDRTQTELAIYIYHILCLLLMIQEKVKMDTLSTSVLWLVLQQNENFTLQEIVTPGQLFTLLCLLPHNSWHLSLQDFGRPKSILKVTDTTFLKFKYPTFGKRSSNQ